MDVQASGRLRLQWWWIAAGIVLMLCGLYIALEPDPDLQLNFRGGDKVLHAVGFAGLMGWWGNVFRQRRDRLIAASGCLVYGALVEVLQAFDPPRSADVLDLLADAVGIAIGLALLHTPLGNVLLRAEQLLALGRSRR
ncbi:MAG: VanZ family protein [Rhodanobacter sp.]